MHVNYRNGDLAASSLESAVISQERRSKRILHKHCFAACAGENEANINFVLHKFKSMQLVPQTPHLAGPGLTGQYMHEDGYQEEWLSPGSAQADLVQRFDPCSMSDTIGFFIAKFRKIC